MNTVWMILFIVGILLFDRYVLVDGWTEIYLGITPLTYAQSETFGLLMFIIGIAYVSYLWGTTKK